MILKITKEDVGVVFQTREGKYSTVTRFKEPVVKGKKIFYPVYCGELSFRDDGYILSGTVEPTDLIKRMPFKSYPELYI